MKTIDKARELILKGITFHFKGHSLKHINNFYDKEFISKNLTRKDIAFVKFLTLLVIRNRGILEYEINILWNLKIY